MEPMDIDPPTFQRTLIKPLKLGTLNWLGPPPSRPKPPKRIRLVKFAWNVQKQVEAMEWEKKKKRPAKLNAVFSSSFHSLTYIPPANSIGYSLVNTKQDGKTKPCFPSCPLCTAPSTCDQSVQTQNEPQNRKRSRNNVIEIEMEDDTEIVKRRM